MIITPADLKANHAGHYHRGWTPVNTTDLQDTVAALESAGARVAELEEGNVRRQVALEARALKAEADAARLREALAGLQSLTRRIASGGERLLQRSSEWCEAEEAIASGPSAEPEGPDYSGLCSAPECGGHCGYAHAVGCEAIREYLAEHGGAPYKAPARTAHLTPPSVEPTQSTACRFPVRSSWSPETTPTSAEPTPMDREDCDAAIAWFTRNEPMCRNLGVLIELARYAVARVPSTPQPPPITTLSIEIATPSAEPTPRCPDAAKHTPCPASYLAWHEWAEKMASTHEQQQCTCGLWLIWTPKAIGT